MSSEVDGVKVPDIAVDEADRLEVFPVAIGAYDHHKDLEVEAEVGRVVELLKEFGGRDIPWDTAMSSRGADSVSERMAAWSRPGKAMDTVLYWVGHGWSNGQYTSLAHARSPAVVQTFGVIPPQISEPVCIRQATAAGHWAMVVIDTCWSGKFVDLVNAHISTDSQGADAVVLVGVSSDGSTALGRFADALGACLHENFRAAHTIELWQLIRELERRLPEGLVIGRRLGDSALKRRAIPLAASLSVPLDLLREVEEIVAGLSDDERRHFLIKAQGAEEGEVAWFFEGREQERREIARWLRAATGGLLTVSGRAGAGKSALLGHVLVHSLANLRWALVRAGLVDPLPKDEMPPDEVFDEVIHLTGMALPSLVHRIATAAGLADFPEDDGSAATAATSVDWLIAGLEKRNSQLTLLVDALDEANDPITLARAVLRRVASVNGVRVVVGTRASTRESPDHPAPDDEDLLVALGSREKREDRRLIWVSRDREAVKRYAARRLLIARDRGILLISGCPADDADIHRVAKAVGDCDREFLFARLAVYELLARPELLHVSNNNGLAELLAADHRELFSAAVDRLAGRSAVFLPLLEALALARGRGIPVIDGVWATMATALAVNITVTDEDISKLLRAAEPYIAVDIEASQTVYRLAHRAFVEHFFVQWEDR